MAEETVRLTVVGPSGAAISHRLVGDRVRIGREAANEIQLGDGETSRLHAELVRDGLDWTLHDRGSRNGTRVNGRTISAPQRLKRGDEICIGVTTILFDVGADRIGVRGSTRVFPRAAPGESALDAPELVGRAPAFVAAIETARRVADSTATVLVLGESGTGKELLSRLLHTASRRASGPYVVVNCPALPGALLESELFGVERGVATGVEARQGIFEVADGGTLLLDEIGDMDPTAQAKLLRVLETRRIDRVGGRTPVTIDVRVVAATNHDLAADVEAGKFRRDLFHRLDGVTIRVPPLRERREDIPHLVEHFVARSSRPHAVFSEEAMALLMRHRFSGNVRELENLVQRACLLADGPAIGPGDLSFADPGTLDGDDPGPRVASILDRVVTGQVSFWEAVATPYLRRELARADAVQLVALARERAGGSYKAMARDLRIESEYKRLLNFIHSHGLGS